MTDGGMGMTEKIRRVRREIYVDITLILW